MNMLKEKVAIVTGAARGLGLSIAEHLGRQGAHLLLCDLDEKACKEAASSLRKLGITVEAARCDVSVAKDVDALMVACRVRYGHLDILVNNAGGSANTALKIEDLSEADYTRVMDWNVRSTFLCTQRGLPLMPATGGSIINISSVAGRFGSELLSPGYSTAKAAVIGMSRSLAKHLGPRGIRVNVIAPGFIKTGARTEALWQTVDEMAVLGQVALRRRGEMEEIGQVALFLASEMSSYITGAVIDVNGGLLSA